MKSRRIWELDFYRGFAILLVVFDHAMYVFSQMFSSWQTSGVTFLEKLSFFGGEYLMSDLRQLWRPAFLFLFFSVSGLCTAFSRNNFLRGLKLACVAALVSVVTWFAAEISGQEVFILFGVLHCFAFIIIFYSVVEFAVNGIFALTAKIKGTKENEKTKKLVLSALSLILCIVFFIINDKFNVKSFKVFENYETVKTDNPFLGLFFYVDNWWSADYFPVFPYIAFFFCGAAFAEIMYPQKKTLFPFIDGEWHKLITVVGKYSIWFYIGGEVFMVGLAYILSLIFLGGV
jgi:uncharacterized membrane protein